MVIINSKVCSSLENNVRCYRPFPGLHSPRIGEQCEKIVRFPRLVEKYPFPVLINSAFLRLGDVFIGGYVYSFLFS